MDRKTTIHLEKGGDSERGSSFLVLYAYISLCCKTNSGLG